jgi:hypothetical protein
MVYSYHSDPGHGWAEVPYIELVRLGINKNVSSYSYRDNDNNVFLEEDCDMSLWYHAHEAHYGKYPEIADVLHDHDCFVRNLNRYVPI